MTSYASSGLFRAIIGTAFFFQVLPAFSQNYSGDAKDVSANISLGLLNVSATVNNVGPLPSTGGNLTNTLVNANLTGLLSTGVVSASTLGAGGLATSSATVDGLSILPLTPISLTASVVQANSTANAATAFGSSTITDLVFAGLPVTITGAPNQTVFAADILGNNIAELIINEQIPLTFGADHQITVNALDLILLGGAGSIGSGDVIISSAESDLTPLGAPGTPEPGSWAFLSGIGITGVMIIRQRRGRI